MSVKIKIFVFLLHPQKKTQLPLLIDLTNTLSQLECEPNKDTFDVSSFEPFSDKITNEDYMPNFCSAFCCREWSGLCCERIHTNVLKSGDYECSIFALDQCFVPVQKDEVQEALAFNSTRKTPKHSGIVNSIKIHFFKSHMEKCREDKLDFLYSSSIPLFHSSDYYVTDVFNYNCNDCQCVSIENCKLVAYYVEETSLCGITYDLILKLRGPDKSNSDNVVLMGNWCEDVLSILCPNSKSSFMNMRTFCRDYGNSVFFQDLPILFRGETNGSSIPLEIMFYSCLNSLSENSMDMLLFPHIFNEKTEKRIDILNGLRIVRDCLAPWTFCCFEGMYISDTSLKQNIEDQPFPFSFVKGQRIFQKDDCEGRVCEAHVMAELFQTFYQILSHDLNESNLQHKIYRYAKHYFDKGKENTRIDITFDNWCNLLAVCYHIGKLFCSEVIEMHTTVGDVNFAVFNGEDVKSDEEEKKLVGHSFGLLVFLDCQKKQHTCILECTGWERLKTSSDIPICRQELELMRSIVKFKLSPNCPLKINVCGYLSQDREERVYENICLGNGCLFLSIDKSLEDWGGIQFGTNMKNFQRGKTLDYQHLRHDTLTEFEKEYIKKRDIVNLKFKTKDFLSEMCTLSRLLDNKTNKLPVLCFFQWFDMKNLSEQNKNKLCMCMKKAFDIQSMHAAYEKSIPNIRKCLCTPHKHCSEYLMLMRKNWKIISYGKFEGPVRGVRFSIQSKNTYDNTNNSCEEVLKMYMEQCVDMNLFRVQSRPFMHSIIYNIHYEDNLQ